MTYNWDGREKCIAMASGDAEIAEHLFSIFLDELPNRHIAINHAYQNNQYKELRSEIHTLLGGAKWCCIDPIEKLTRQIEQLIDNQEYNGITELLVELESAINTIYSEQDIAPPAIAHPG